ncbi:Nuclear hormone receptor family member nhr-127 [Caenorhabditis elegans]|uniref:Nuclear hormone receptor family member nhr-127 n=1 Tax=Caenorhabditis elegans TaxID=6239 RepID=NH127_CAEEL|nr:Nuclear hormone receptor family member nhr-127 [Caenorhabditis elegans]O18087.2 RecName: Full=Nuclear hormone receptor family member nhr-127 [Caenorhabditis elegans]CAB07671.2 Nuclear hormone receptor family member nhr-127 [Caenorhabditis elegans]|eukprot:NP_507104.2 Nuclear hormone receptor family member nhr-127 [Caenorhabditis elegans]
MKITFSPELSIPCEVCKNQSNGYHFEVLSCGACASFFRRSVVSKIKYQCKDGKKRCQIRYLDRHFCRYCRFSKCVKAGMKAEKIQKNRDLDSSPTPTDQNNCIPSDVLHDDGILIKDIRGLFKQFNPHNASEGCSKLEKLTEGLQFIRRNQERECIKIIDEMDSESLKDVQFKVIGSCATWLLFSSFFQKLEENEKVVILERLWHGWTVLEFLSRSLEIFGNKVIDEKIVFISDNTAIRLITAFENSLKTASPKKSESIKKKLELSFSVIFDELALHFINWKPTEIEISYMQWQIVWSVAEQLLSGNSLEKGEHFTEQLSKDLHEYYVRELKLENYAFRIEKMMDIVQIVQNNFY